MEILIFILISYGITNIIVFGTIFDPLREFLMKLNPGILGSLVTCMMCSSFWVGVVLSLFVVSPIGSIFSVSGLLLYFLTGCFTSGSVWLIHTIQEFFERGFK